MVLVENYLKMFALKEAVQPAGGTGGVTIVLCNYFLDDGQRINCHKKNFASCLGCPIHYTQIMAENRRAEQGANFGKNLAKCCHRTEILLPGAITSERSANAATN